MNAGLKRRRKFKKFVEKKDPADGKVRSFVVWDSRQCDILRELVRRRDDGESFESIAADFNRRKLKQGDGTPWARRQRGRRKVNTFTVKRAYTAMAAMIRENPLIECT